MMNSLDAMTELTDKQYQQWAELLEMRVGLHLNNQQRLFLQTQIALRMRELGHTDHNRYFRRVIDGVSGFMEWSTLIDRLVVKETSFFRHQPSYNMVASYLRNRLQGLKGSFDVWSVGCSTGEEPVSLAIVIEECFREAKMSPYFGILATDINRNALSKARHATYHKRKLESMDMTYFQRYFHQAGADKYQVSTLLRDKICYNNTNILDIERMPDLNMDVIYCQHLLVNFRQDLRHQVADTLVDRLKSGGMLILGLNELEGWDNSEVMPMPTNSVKAYIKR